MDEERRKKLEALRNRSKAPKKEKGFLRTVFDAPIEYGKMGAEAVAQTARSLTDPAWNKALKARLGMGSYDDMTLDELNQVSTDPTSFVMDKKKLKDTKSIVSSGVKDTAGTMAWLVPGGKGYMGALKTGAGAGALTGFQQSDANIFSDPLEAVKDTTVGAGVGAVTGPIVHGVGDLMSKGFKKGASTIYNNIIREPSKKLLKRSIRSGEKVGTEAMEAGAGKGLTKQQIYDNSLKQINTLEDELQNAITDKMNRSLSPEGKTVPLSSLKEATAGLIKDYADAGNTSAVKNITDRITALEAQHGDKIPLNIANKVKRTLYDEIRDASYGEMASAQKEGLKAMARALKEQIAKRVPNADKINQQLGLNGRVADSMEEALAKSPRIGGWSDVVAGGLGYGVSGGNPLGAIGGALAQRAVTSTPSQKIIANTLQQAGKIGSRAIPGINRTVGDLFNRATTVGFSGAGANSLFGQPAKHEDNTQPYTDENTTDHIPENTIPEMPESQVPNTPQDAPMASPEAVQPTNIQGVIDSAAEKYAPGDPEFRKVLHAIAMAESAGNPGAVGDGGNSIGLFQNNMAGGRGAGHSREDLMNPVYNADISAADLVNHYRQGVAQGLSGPDLVAYVSRNGQRPAAGNEYHAAQNYGMIAGADKPLSMNVDPSRQMPAEFTGAQFSSDQPGQNLLADASGGTPSVDMSESVTITNRQTGEQRSVKRSDLPQYGLPVTYKSAASPAPSGTPAPADGMPSKEVLDREIVRARMMGSKESIKAAENLEKLRDDYYPADKEADKKKTQAQLSREELGYGVQEAVDMLLQNEDAVARGEDTPLKIGLLAGPIESLKAKFNMADPESIRFNILISELQATIAKQRGGTSFTPNEQAMLEKYSPKVGDSRQEVVEKLAILSKKMDFFKDVNVEDAPVFQGAGFAN